MALFAPKPDLLRPITTVPAPDRVVDERASGTPEELRGDLVELLGESKVLHKISDLVKYATGASPPELLPVVYDPTVGAAIEQYSDEYRGQRGVYLSIDRPEEIAESFKTFSLGRRQSPQVLDVRQHRSTGCADIGFAGNGFRGVCEHPLGHSLRAGDDDPQAQSREHQEVGGLTNLEGDAVVRPMKINA